MPALPRISENSVVRNAKIAPDVTIWHFCNLYDCEIGQSTQVGSYCEIKQNAKIGKHCRLQSYVFISEGTVLEDYVFVGPKASFLNDKFPSAEKAIAGKWKAEAVVVESHAVIGGGVTVLPGVRIGTHAVIGAGSCVTRDVAAYSVVCGNPARKIGDVRDARYARYLP